MPDITVRATPAAAGRSPLHSDQLGGSITPTNTPIESISQDRRAYLLAELRCAALRARLWAHDIDAMGLALKGGLIDPEEAIEWLDDYRCLSLIGTEMGAVA